jgi:exodeoxyribonuclease V gamma subunit
LLDLFERAARRGRPLSPREVMVMVPDIQAYAPHVQAVFGRLAPDDPRYLPYSLADQPGRGTAPLYAALESLLQLTESRCTASDVLDLLDVPALRRRFGLTEDDLPTLRRWIAEAGIRWGLDGRQKQAFGLPPDEHNSWRFGLRRMLLGYATGEGPALNGVAPYAEIGGLDAQLIGPLHQLLGTLEQYWQAFAAPATPAQWHERLGQLLRDCFEARGDEDDALRIGRLEDALDAWLDACQQAGFTQAIPLAIVAEEWLQSIDQAQLSQRFMGGAVNFGTLLPMRAIPFRVVCLLGMNDGDYPRRVSPPDFDLMALAGQRRPGDRSRRDDDRYMFLEALLSARDVLHISWVGHSVRDNSELPPSVLVGQLRDYLAAGWREPDEAARGAGVLDRLTTVHPLQPFSERYFDAASPLFTYAAEWARARRASAPAEASPLAPWHTQPQLDIRSLQRFLARPAACFYSERLKVHFEAIDSGMADEEPFALDGLENYAATQALLQGALAVADAQAEPALLDAAQRLRQQGVLPAGGFGELAVAALAEDVQRILRRWRASQAHWSMPRPAQELRHAHGALSVEGWLDDLRSAEDGGLVRLLPMAGQLCQGKALRYEKLLPAWVLQLLANANGLGMASRFLAADATVVLQPLAVPQASELLNQLLDAWQAGMQQPLPIARLSAFAWLLAERAEKPPFEAARLCYEGSDAPGAPPGELQREPCLARSWRSFSALHAQGFEQWLPLYRPLLDTASVESEA